MGLVKGQSAVPEANDRFIITLKLLTNMSWSELIDAYNTEFGEEAVPGDGRNRWARQHKSNPLRVSLERGSSLTAEDVEVMLEILQAYGVEHLNAQGEGFLQAYAPEDLSVGTINPSTALSNPLATSMEAPSEQTVPSFPQQSPPQQPPQPYLNPFLAPDHMYWQAPWRTTMSEGIHPPQIPYEPAFGYQQAQSSGHFDAAMAQQHQYIAGYDAHGNYIMGTYAHTSNNPTYSQDDSQFPLAENTMGEGYEGQGGYPWGYGWHREGR